MGGEIYTTDQDGETAAAEDKTKQPSELEEQALMLKLRRWFLADDQHSNDWRDQAKLDFDFVAGDQWDDKAKTVMADENRVPLTFNYTAAFIKAVCGLEIGSRHDVIYLPQEVAEGDIPINETLTQTSQWMGGQCDADGEQSEAFRDTTICGMGWTESRIDHELDKDGKYIEEKLDPVEMRWDRSARKKNLQDSRRRWRVRNMTLEEARDLFPEEEDGDLNCAWAIGYDVGPSPQPVEERQLKLENSEAPDESSEVTIIQCQWYERECYYRVALADPTRPGQMVEEEMDPKGWKSFMAEAKAAGVKPTYAKQHRRVYKQAFIGGKILGEVHPCPDPEGFTLQCITGELDKTKGTWYGLVKIMRSPAMNANKWLSQALHILNSTAKGGVLAEKGVFKNLTEARKTLAAPDSITEVADKAIQLGRVMAKPGTGMAAPYIQMVGFAVKAIPDVTGINLELLGMVDRNQPGILEAQRKQAGMTILATLFDALRRYRKEIGRIRLYFIQEYIPDGKIMRIVGPNGYKGVKLIKNTEMMAKYDVIVSDAPTSPNQKDQTWTALMQMSQVDGFKQLMTPEAVVESLNYCPLPSKIVEILKKGLQQPPKPEQIQAQQIAEATARADIQAKTAKAGHDDASALQAKATAILTLAKAGSMELENEITRAVMAQFRAGPQFPGVQGMLGATDDFAVSPPLGGDQLQGPPQLPAYEGNGGGMLDVADLLAGMPPEPALAGAAPPLA